MRRRARPRRHRAAAPRPPGLRLGRPRRGRQLGPQDRPGGRPRGHRRPPLRAPARQPRQPHARRLPRGAAPAQAGQAAADELRAARAPRRRPAAAAAAAAAVLGALDVGAGESRGRGLAEVPLLEPLARRLAQVLAVTIFPLRRRCWPESRSSGECSSLSGLWLSGANVFGTFLRRSMSKSGHKSLMKFKQINCF